jgi:hypothetical protein
MDTDREERKADIIPNREYMKQKMDANQEILPRMNAKLESWGEETQAESEAF